MQVIDLHIDSQIRTALTHRRWSWLLGIVSAALVIGLAYLGVRSGLFSHFTLEDLRTRRSALKMFVHLHPVASVGLYMAMYCAVVALSLPGALFMTLTGGVLFGPLEGAGAAMVGVTSGAVLMFLAAQTMIGQAVRRRAAPNGLFSKVQAGVRRHAFTYILFLRLLPVTPIWLTNIAAGLVRPPLWIYVAATIIGIAPSTFIYASIGSDIDRMFAAGASPDLRAVFQLRTVVPLIGLAFLALTPLAFGWWRKRR